MKRYLEVGRAGLANSLDFSMIAFSLVTRSQLAQLCMLQPYMHLPK